MVTVVKQPALPRRKNRYPKHPFRLVNKPWQLQPFLCAPVLPGETMENLLVQSRAVTDPILDPLAGWWLEYYFFYVKLTDLDARDLLTQMIIDPDNADISTLQLSAVEPWSFSGEGGIPWPKLCTKVVVEHYFRNEDETWNTAAIDSIPLVAIGDDRSNVWNSLMMVDDLNAIDVSVTVGVDDVITMSEMEDARRQYELLKAHGLMKAMTWEDYLRQSGVKGQEVVDPRKPELIRYTREWSYPSNTIDPSNGTPRSAVSWAVVERGDKARFFPEPGFILGLTCARPKVYMRNQTSLAAGFMLDSASWLPPMLQDDAWASITTHVTASGSGPLPVITDAQGYAWDVRDLLLYGEQFINFDPAAVTGRSLVDLPTSAGLKEYVDADDINSLFVGSTDATRTIRQDGIVQLTIKGRQTDTTPPPGTPIA